MDNSTFELSFEDGELKLKPYPKKKKLINLWRDGDTDFLLKPRLEHEHEN